MMRFLMLVVLGFLSLLAQGAPLRLDAAPSHTLAGNLALWHDAEGTADLNTALQKTFVPLPGDLSLGFAPGAVWLRATLQREAGDPSLWWLDVAPGYLDDVRLYVRGADGRYVERRSGLDVPVSAREVSWRNAVFVLRLETPGEHEIVVRIQSQSSLSARLSAWSPEAFVASAAKDTMARGMYFGLSGLVALFYLLFWRSTRERVHLMYGLYVASLILVTLNNSGWIVYWLPDTPAGWPGTFRALVLCSLLSLVHYFYAVLIDLKTFAPRAHRWYLRTAYGASATGVALVLAGRYDLALPFNYVVALVLWVVIMTVAVRMMRRGFESARFLLLGFVPVIGGASLYLMSTMGWINASFWSENAYTIGSLVHVLVMGTYLFSRYTQLRKDRDTAELRANAEHAAREEQREFVAMVSHEFRTPLAISESTLHNLKNSPTLGPRDLNRVTKLQRATTRLISLMDTYLAADRLARIEHQPSRFEDGDVAATCRAAAADLADVGEPGAAAIVLNLPTELRAVHDRELLRIAVRNLLDNARRHSPAKQSVHLSARLNAGWIEVAVQDTGEGIPDDELPHIFSRYFRGRAARRKPGAGLGLHLVASIAKRHGGTVTVRRLEPQGSEFLLRWPAGLVADGATR